MHGKCRWPWREVVVLQHSTRVVEIGCGVGFDFAVKPPVTNTLALLLMLMVAAIVGALNHHGKRHSMS